MHAFVRHKGSKKMTNIKYEIFNLYKHTELQIISFIQT